MVHTGDAIMSETHEIIGTGEYCSPEFVGTVNLKEIKCEGKYIMVQMGANYCTHCGEEL